MIKYGLKTNPSCQWTEYSRETGASPELEANQGVLTVQERRVEDQDQTANGLDVQEVESSQGLEAENDQRWIEDQPQAASGMDIQEMRSSQELDAKQTFLAVQERRVEDQEVELQAHDELEVRENSRGLEAEKRGRLEVQDMTVYQYIEQDSLQEFVDENTVQAQDHRNATLEPVQAGRQCHQLFCYQLLVTISAGFIYQHTRLHIRCWTRYRQFVFCRRRTNL